MDVSSAVVALEAGSPERGAVERCAARARAVAILFAGVEEGLANARPMMLSHGRQPPVAFQFFSWLTHGLPRE